MEMHQVRYFLAVARTLNFTRAAEECNVAQPSLTRAIKQLEDELGGDLFRRERPHALMTDLGERMLPLLRQCYESAVGARSLASLISKGEVGSLKLAVSQSVNLALLTASLAELNRAFEGLELILTRADASQILELLKEGTADFAVAAALPPWERLDRWPLFEEGFQVLAPRGHTLAGRDEVALEDLRGERLLRRPYCENAGDFHALMRDRAIDPVRAHQLSSDADLGALISAGLGIAVAPNSAPTSDGLRGVALGHCGLNRTIYLYGVAGRQRSPVGWSIMKLLRSADWPQARN